MTNSNPGVLIVTGASRGIGAAIARRAAHDGYAVAVNYARNGEAAARVVTEIEAAGGRAMVIQGDVAIEADILRLFETAERELGPITALVNNAGITGGFAKVDDVTEAAISRMLATNVTGTLLCTREAVCRMSTRHGGSGGAIVNISSMAAKTGGTNEWVHYAASKGAINTFTVGLAREVADQGIRANAVAPGLIESDLHGDNGDPGRPARIAPTIPMQRAGLPEEIAEGVAWLLSPAASYVTGTILEIGGGR